MVMTDCDTPRAWLGCEHEPRRHYYLRRRVQRSRFVRADAADELSNFLPREDRYVLLRRQVGLSPHLGEHMRNAITVTLLILAFAGCHGMRVNATALGSIACSGTSGCAPQPGNCAPACRHDANGDCWCGTK